MSNHPARKTIVEKELQKALTLMEVDGAMTSRDILSAIEKALANAHFQIQQQMKGTGY